jgi:phosphopantothenoylcysteine decarboxylase/phosphopantothenate--cysteine ligase
MTARHSESSLRVVLGVTGGIAAYKAVQIARSLVTRGHQVTVIPTVSALKFVGRPTWEAISRSDVPVDLFDGVAEVTHVALGQQADLVIVAPATANFLANYAHGTAEDLLGTTLLATNAPVVVAPAMHTEMWENPATTENLATLVARGVHVIGPESGPLTGQDSGPGRMSEPEDIVDFALSVVGPQPLAVQKVLISAGGTREPIDPVRFIGNRSTGAMGVALAQVAAALGAEVTLVHGSLEVSLPRGVDCVFAPTAAKMHAEMTARFPHSAMTIMAAAVADWSVQPAPEKLSKADGADWPELAPTPDIAAELGASKTAEQRLVVFAAETTSDDEELLARARAKMESKSADVVVANRVGEQVGFGQTDTAVWIVQRSGAPVLSTGSKLTVAGHLFDVLLSS